MRCKRCGGETFRRDTKDARSFECRSCGFVLIERPDVGKGRVGGEGTGLAAAEGGAG
jgi:DNA-directed RNA polymerase subunit RPC12/RpoP